MRSVDVSLVARGARSGARDSDASSSDRTTQTQTHPSSPASPQPAYEVEAALMGLEDERSRQVQPWFEAVTEALSLIHI